MAQVADAANAWLSDYNTPGVPSSGEKDPPKAEGRALFALIDYTVGTATSGVNSLTPRVVALETSVNALQAGQSGGAYVFSTKSSMDAFLTPSANSRAEVIGDPTPANDGVYKKVGGTGTGSWSYVGPSVITSVNGTGIATPPRDYVPYVQGIDDPVNAIAVGVTPTGRTDLAMASRALRTLVDDQRQGAGQFRGFRPIVNVKLGQQLAFGQVMQGGVILDVAQRRLGVYTTALALSSDPLAGIFYYGQSNAGAGSGEAPPLISDLPPYPYQVVQFATAPDAYGTSPIIGALTDFREAFDAAATGQSPCSAAGWSLAAWDVKVGLRSPGYLTATAWEGGQDITHFVSGSQNYINLMKFAARSPIVASYYGRSFALKALVFVQGENYSANYATALGALIDGIVPALKTATGQAANPLFVFLQINNTDTATTASGVELAQLQVGIARLGTGAILAGPMYQYPLREEVGEDIHVTRAGRLMMGDLVAHVIRKGASFVPLYATSCVRSGAVIDITYAVPAGNLVMDVAWVAAAALNGFKARKASDASALTINTVAITGANTVRLTLSADPGPAVIWSYAMVTDTVDDGWASGRGQLCSPTTEESSYYLAGYAVPRYVTHYACRQEMETPS